MIIYWDFDGVLVDSWEIINKIKECSLYDNCWDFYSTLDWGYILKTANIIEENCCLLEKLNVHHQTRLFTAFSSYDEAIKKTEWVKARWHNMEIIFIPHGLDKSTFVNCKGNILIDDNEKTIANWNKNGGIGFLYDNINPFHNKIEKLLGEL